MENKKELIKTLGIVIIILIVIIYNFIYKKENEESYDYSEVITNESADDSNDKEEIEKIKVYVTGEVKHPGVIELELGSRIEDAIILAGGTTDSSDLSLINLAYTLEDGQKIYIPNVNENFTKVDSITENMEGIVESTNTNSKSKVNINTGGVSELSSLPGVGESLAQKIITYRETNGKFKKLDDLKNVTGIGEKKYDGLKEYICLK